MVRFRFSQFFQLKVSFLLLLLVILFLLLSFVSHPHDNFPLENLIQSINSITSWPNIMLENLPLFHLHWVATLFSIQIFWFVVIYIILLLIKFWGKISNLFPGE